MRTAIVQIGNSDDKLTQARWHEFVVSVESLILSMCERMHFSACSDGGKPWQNACFVFEIAAPHIDGLKSDLTDIRAKFHQDSAAWTEGCTQFI